MLIIARGESAVIDYHVLFYLGLNICLTSLKKTQDMETRFGPKKKSLFLIKLWWSKDKSIYNKEVFALVMCITKRVMVLRWLNYIFCVMSNFWLTNWQFKISLSPNVFMYRKNICCTRSVIRFFISVRSSNSSKDKCCHFSQDCKLTNPAIWLVLSAVRLVLCFVNLRTLMYLLSTGNTSAFAGYCPLCVCV